jgi:2-polyprenyl-3-methyl-5-hydroxy-6-metoxy-1,4-benzoquinol methylase
MHNSDTHWSKISPNPVAPAVQQHVLAQLRSRRRERIVNHVEYFDKFAEGKTVLDIGIVEHETGQVDSPHWRHGRIKRVAKKTVGLDILAPAVEELVQRGFDARVVDATGDADLGERFERVFVGDVIEHVNNPVGLLQFAKRHLVPGGLALFTTPNPFFLPYVIQSVRQGVQIPNADHIAWITPPMALELGYRADFPLHEYRHIGGGGTSLFSKTALAALSLLGVRESEPFSAVYAYTYQAA